MQVAVDIGIADSAAASHRDLLFLRSFLSVDFNKLIILI
jgi:hypothetical protein